MIFNKEDVFYNENIKRYIGLFGSIFNDLYIKRADQYIKVPIKYGPGNRFSKVSQSSDGRDDAKVARIVPAMAFELQTFYKDNSRKTNAINIKKDRNADTNGVLGFSYNPIPYTFLFKLEILTKNLDDMFQIIEQIIPIFDPNLTITIQDQKGLVVDNDIGVYIQDIQTDDNYEDDKKREISYTITFELKGFLHKKPQKGYIVREAVLLGYYNDIDQTEAGEVLATETYLDPIEPILLTTQKLDTIVEQEL